MTQIYTDFLDGINGIYWILFYHEAHEGSDNFEFLILNFELGWNFSFILFLRNSWSGCRSVQKYMALLMMLLLYILPLEKEKGCDEIP